MCTTLADAPLGAGGRLRLLVAAVRLLAVHATLPSVRSAVFTELRR